MTGRYNALLLGATEHVVQQLEAPIPTPDELRAALINAFRRIDSLEHEVRELREQIGRA